MRVAQASVCIKIGVGLVTGSMCIQVSIEVRDPFVNDGLPTRIFADCVPLRKSNIFEPRCVVFECIFVDFHLQCRNCTVSKEVIIIKSANPTGTILSGTPGM